MTLEGAINEVLDAEAPRKCYLDMFRGRAWHDVAACYARSLANPDDVTWDRLGYLAVINGTMRLRKTWEKYS